MQSSAKALGVQHKLYSDTSCFRDLYLWLCNTLNQHLQLTQTFVACFRSLYKKTSLLMWYLRRQPLSISSLGSGPSFHTDHMLYETHRFKTHLFESQKKPVTPEIFTLFQWHLILDHLPPTAGKMFFRGHAPAICHAGGRILCNSCMSLLLSLR